MHSIMAAIRHQSFLLDQSMEEGWSDRYTHMIEYYAVCHSEATFNEAAVKWQQHYQLHFLDAVFLCGCAWERGWLQRERDGCGKRKVCAFSCFFLWHTEPQYLHTLYKCQDQSIWQALVMGNSAGCHSGDSSGECHLWSPWCKAKEYDSQLNVIILLYLALATEDSWRTETAYTILCLKPALEITPAQAQMASRKAFERVEIAEQAAQQELRTF